MQPHVCCDLLESMLLLDRLKFDAVFFDRADEPSGQILLEQVRAEDINRNTIVFRLVEDTAKLRAVFGSGAAFCIAQAGIDTAGEQHYQGCHGLYARRAAALLPL